MTSSLDLSQQHSFHRLLIRYLRWARSAAPFRLNAHLKVAPAQCVYGFYFLSDFSTMPYYRRPYKRPRYGKAIKYSVQQKCITATTPDASFTAKVEVVPGTDVEGMRKVKHLTVSMSPDTTDTLSFYWALVYVPQGTTPGDINIGSAISGSMYEPNQFVMNCGIMSTGAGPIRVSSPIARNLNDGDGIYLLIRDAQDTGPIQYNCVVRYAISLH